MEILRIFEEIRLTSGTKAKAEIIEKHKDNSDFIRLAIFMMDTNIKTNLSTSKINKVVNTSLAEPISDFNAFLDYLAFDCTGTNINIASVQKFIHEHSEDIQEILKGIATKSYKVGVTAKGFNKVVQIVSTHNVQRAKLFADEYHKLDKKYPNSTYYFTQKLDGIRGMAFVTDGKVEKILSRGNKEMIGLDGIFSGIETGVYDGEFVIDGADFNTIQSVVMSEDTDKSKVKFKIFDMITYSDYEKGVSDLTYDERRKNMDNLKLENPMIDVIDILDSCKYGELEGMKETLFEVAMLNGWEGLMVNVGISPYQAKKTDAILKVKEFETVDLKIVGFNEGEGKLKGTTGSISCDYKGFIVDVPSMKDEIRKMFWENQNNFIGKTIEVKYFQESSNEKGGISLRFPSFVRLREDK